MGAQPIDKLFFSCALQTISTSLEGLPEELQKVHNACPYINAHLKTVSISKTSHFYQYVITEGFGDDPVRIVMKIKYLEEYPSTSDSFTQRCVQIAIISSGQPTDSVEKVMMKFFKAQKTTNLFGETCYMYKNVDITQRKPVRKLVPILY